MENPGQYEQILMVSVKVYSPGVSGYYIGVPNEDLLRGFQKFGSVKEADLPKEIDAFHLGDT
jgi:hypothetical protein